MIDTTYHYTPFPAAPKATYRLRIIPSGPSIVALLTELAPNLATSMTISDLVTQIAGEHALDPARTIWIEHCPEPDAADPTRESYTHVTFLWTNGLPSAPEWRPMPRDEIELLVGVVWCLSCSWQSSALDVACSTSCPECGTATHHHPRRYHVASVADVGLPVLQIREIDGDWRRLTQGVVENVRPVYGSYAGLMARVSNRGQSLGWRRAPDVWLALPD
jgi:hypothetical protein